jgi:glutamine cyclotransferase
LEWKVENGRQFIYANVYQTDKIVKIDLLSGNILETHRFPQLTKKERESGHLEVLNGIAYH